MDVSDSKPRRVVVYSMKECAFCGEMFRPLNSKPNTCSWQCRFRLIQRSFPASDECWRWPQSLNVQTGYGQFHAELSGGRNQAVHRLSHMLNNGPIPEGRLVMHSCDNRWCFNPRHLSVGTSQDNCDDMMAKGRQGKPKHRRLEDHPNAKLTVAAVHEIQSCKGRYKELAEKYGVSTKTIFEVRAGRSWQTAPQFCGPILPIALNRKMSRAKNSQPE